MYSFILLLLHVYCVFADSALTPVTVSTNVGAISGIRKQLDIAGKPTKNTKFLGIPYAEDTSGQNRFKRPIPKANFTGTFNAYTLSPPCMQFPNLLSNCTTNMTEDCLMLNIYVPRDLGRTSPSRLVLLPVMIWIHGGGYMSGAAREYPGEVLSSVGDVIVVTINYRLAEFGFLNVGDARANGNQGLWDQHLAIKWVHDNIQAFRGDPNEVTIFGESMGAVSVTLQSMYAGNKGLFKRVIAESGSALSYWAVNRYPNATSLLQASGCATGATDPVECLRGLSTDAFYQILTNPVAQCCRFPSVDHDFIVEDPMDIVFGSNTVSFEARQFFRSLDYITGVNNGEGALYVVLLWLNALRQTDMDNITVTESDFENIIVPGIIAAGIRPPTNESIEAIKQALVFEYVHWKDPSDVDEMRNQLIKISNDMSFFIATNQLIEAHSMAPSLGHSYYYEFTAEPPVRRLPTPAWFHGANHIDEIEYVFGGPFQKIDVLYINTSRNGNVTEKDRMLSLGMMTAWSNFAKSG